jgi:hypothetical protein
LLNPSNENISRKKILIIFILFITASCVGKGSLHIDAQIIYNMGGAQPVARQKFYLLNKNPLILRADDPDFQQRMQNAKTEEEKNNLLMASAVFLLFAGAVTGAPIVEGKEKNFLGTVNSTRQFWEPYLVAETQTDFDGKAVFENLAHGEYWLIGQTETRAAFTYWNLKVKIDSGENKLLLDQNNALYSK